MRKKLRLKQDETQKKPESPESGSFSAGQRRRTRAQGGRGGRRRLCSSSQQCGKSTRAAGRAGPVRCQLTGRRAPRGETPSIGLGHPQAGTALAVTPGAQRTARPALWGRGAMAPGLAALTTSTVPPIKTNSFVMISTISRTCEGSTKWAADPARRGDTCSKTAAPPPRRGPAETPSPGGGRRWRGCTGGPCPRSCGGRQLRCTSSGACGDTEKGTPERAIVV